MTLKKHVLILLLAAIVFSLIATPVVFGQIDVASNEDWPMFHHDAAHSGYTESKMPANPELIWQFDTSGNHVASTPIVVDGRLYVGSDNGNIYCLNASTGTKLWVNIYVNDSVTSSLAIADSRVYFGSRNFNVYCLDALNGSEIWTYHTGNGIHSSPVLYGGNVYVASVDGNIYCLNAQTGEKEWSFVTLDRSGNYDIHTNLGPLACGISSPAIDDGLVFVGGTSLYCLRADSGTLVWSYPTLTPCSPTISNGKVYFLDYYGVAYCLNEANGALVWSSPGIERNKGDQNWEASESSPAVAYGEVFFGGFGVRCLNASTGAEVWTLNQITSSSPAISDQRIYIGLNGTIQCLNAENGSLVWAGTTWDYTNTSPAIAEGTIYIGGNAIYAYGTPTLTPPLPTPNQTSQYVLGSSISTPIIAAATLGIAGTTIVIAITYLSRKQKQAYLKRLILPIAFALIFLVGATSLIALYGNGAVSTNSPGGTTQLPFSSENSNRPNIVWQTNIEHFANSIAYDNSKIFISTNSGDYAYDAKNGSLIWSSDSGDGKIQIYNGRLYVAGFGSMVYCLDESTGNKLMSFAAPVWSSYHSKGDPAFFAVADNRVIVTGDATAVYDATSGQEFWEATDRPQNWSSFPLKPIIILGPAASGPESSYVYVAGSSRVNLNNGEQIWTSKEANYFPAPPIVVDDKVIFWDSTPNKYAQYDTNNQLLYGNNILCVDAASGKTLWNFYVGTYAYQPTVYDGQLLFGAQNGNFYALNITNGSVAWVTKIDTQNLMSGQNLPAAAKTNSAPSISQVKIDKENNKITWAFAITQSQIDGINGNNLYVGSIVTLNLSSGKLIQTASIQRNGSIWDAIAPMPALGLATLGNTAYLTAGNDLWIVNQDTGKVNQTVSYDHTTRPPIQAESTIYVATDLYLTAYS
jgi:outer membrane protein assembly factor BamB